MFDIREIWTKLRNFFEPKSMNRRLIMKFWLYNLEILKKTSIEEYL